MRYRRLSYRYTMVVSSRQTWPFGEVWTSGRLRFLTQTRWRPDADICETRSAVEIVVDLAGVEEDDFEVQLFEDALVVEGQRQLSACQVGSVYHMAGIRQGPFRVELMLPVLVQSDRIVARYDRGLLRITLPKQTATD